MNEMDSPEERLRQMLEQGDVQGALAAAREDIRSCGEALERCPGPESLLAQMDACARLAQVQERTGDREGARESWKTVRTLETSLPEDSPERGGSRHITSLLREGALMQQEDRLPEAVALYHEAWVSARALLKRQDRPESWHMMSLSCGYLGRALYELGDLTNARDRLEESVTLARRLADRTDAQEARWNLCSSAQALSLLYSDLEDPEGALKWARREMDERWALVEETRDAENAWPLIRALNRTASLEEARDGLDEAEELYRQSISLTEELPFSSLTPEQADLVCCAQEGLGEVLLRQGDLEGAWELYEESLPLRESVVEAAKTPAASQDLAVLLERMGDLQREQGEAAQALTYYRRTLDILEQLDRADSSPLSRRDLCVVWHKMGEAYQDGEDVKEAVSCFRRSLAIARELDREKSVQDSTRMVAICNGSLAFAAQFWGDTREADRLYRETLELVEPVTGENSLPEDRRTLAFYLERLAEVTDSRQEAQALFQRCLEIRIPLARETGLARDRNTLKDLYRNMSRAAEKAGETARVVEYHNACLQVLEASYQEDPSEQTLLDLCQEEMDLGDFLQEQKDLEGALKHFDACRVRLEDSPDREQLPSCPRTLTLVCERLGEALEEAGKPGKARPFYVRCVELSRMLASQEDTADSWYSLGMALQNLSCVVESGQVSYLISLNGLTCARKAVDMRGEPADLDLLLTFLANLYVSFRDSTEESQAWGREVRQLAATLYKTTGMDRYRQMLDYFGPDPS